MTCETVKIGNAVAIVCSRGRRTRKRCACGMPATKLCDHKEPGQRRTCDAPLCNGCATPAGPDRDLCPAHVSKP